MTIKELIELLRQYSEDSKITVLANIDKKDMLCQITGVSKDEDLVSIECG